MSTLLDTVCAETGILLRTFIYSEGSVYKLSLMVAGRFSIIPGYSYPLMGMSVFAVTATEEQDTGVLDSVMRGTRSDIRG
ncbi:MAG: hypothetical protein QY318_02350 [Candidatus Dojkabacteria bacterium]|nr:MAG: hypothetical protein QY318_02350 [Candidatus Dojkabacteria bacterium]